MEIRYCKEKQKSYMVIRQEEPEKMVAFQKKMLDSVSLDTLLHIKNRVIDGETFNYYDISSRITLRQMFGSKYIDSADIEQLRTDMRDAYSELEKYLLDSERVVIDPDFIFYSYCEDRFLFTYNISVSNEENLMSAQSLLDYLLERVSPNDKEASDYVYTLFEYAEKVDFAVWKVIDFFLTEDGVKESTGENGVEKRDGPTDTGLYESIYPERNEAVADTYDMNQDIYFDKNDTNEKSKYGAFSLVIVGALGLCICVFVLAFMKLTSDERLIAYAGSGASALILIIGISLVLRQKVINGKKEIEAERVWGKEMYEAQYGPKASMVNLRDFIAQPTKRRNVQSNKAALEPTCPEYTVLFEPNPEECEYKLYSIDKKNKQHIILDKFPYTIGKMSGYSDGIIDHPSISRLHARIDLRDKNLYLTDLNSTNCTYLNGIKLNPNESRLLDVGDEIRLGSLNYCLRC